jgi:hypothetical protein
VSGTLHLPNPLFPFPEPNMSPSFNPFTSSLQIDSKDYNIQDSILGTKEIQSSRHFFPYNLNKTNIEVSIISSRNEFQK